MIVWWLHNGSHSIHGTSSNFLNPKLFNHVVVSPDARAVPSASTSQAGAENLVSTYYFPTSVFQTCEGGNGWTVSQNLTGSNMNGVPKNPTWNIHSQVQRSWNPFCAWWTRRWGAPRLVASPLQQTFVLVISGPTVQQFTRRAIYIQMGFSKHCLKNVALQSQPVTETVQSMFYPKSQLLEFSNIWCWWTKRARHKRYRSYTLYVMVFPWQAVATALILPRNVSSWKVANTPMLILHSRSWIAWW